MCHAVFIEPDEYYEELYRQAGRKRLDLPELTKKTDLWPGANMLCLGSGKNGVGPGILNWGYPSFDDKKLINTRVETVTQKPIFAGNYQRFKCAVLVSGFYEWDKDKKKYALRGDEPWIYLAAIYDLKTLGFSILTRASYGPLAQIHDRSPVMLNQEQAEQYCAGQMEYRILKDLQMPQQIIRMV